MAIVLKTCPHCGRRWTDTYTAGIGKPFYYCSICHQTIIEKDTTEWELKSLIGKIAYFGIFIWTGIIVSFGVVLVAYSLLGKDRIERLLLPIWSGAFLLVMCIGVWSTMRDIKESRERMKNHEYRKTLKELGLL